ncbi:Frigida-like protein [Corchorus olitorius]|uniref:Frigida-like protein n=1 Tax=Corchorus olitorius TaxID=93759 RepID=A0A1R3GB42_9ROSI|nr:Frigida-like protein [Corchorus olitorius]
MCSLDDIAADLILLESQSKTLASNLGKLQGGSSLVPSLTLQCQKLQVLSNSIHSAIQTRFQELQSKEKEIENRLKELEFREKELGKLSKLKLDDKLIRKGSSLLDLRFIVSTDGERMLMFLNEHENDHEKLVDEVISALKMSKNPGKLVWEAVRGVFIERGSVGVERNVERRSCLVLLEGLIRVRPKIRKKVIKSVSFVATEWKLKIGMEGEDDMEILLFFMLAAGYGLLGQFKSKDIRNLFERVAKYKQASLFSHDLGFAEKAASESCVLHSQVKMEQLSEVSDMMSEARDDRVINYPCQSSADIRFLASTNADRLLMFLNEHGYDDNIGDGVYNALKMSGNSAKLVLDVVKAGISEMANVGVEMGMVHNSCMVLLEQLMRFRPEVSQKLKRKALHVAQHLKGNLKPQGNYSKEVLVFLMLVGVYGLTNEFNFKEIESLFECVSQYKQAPMLSRILGFVDQTLARGVHHSQVKIEQSEAENFQSDSFLPSDAKIEQYIASSSTSWGPQLLSFSINMDSIGLILFLSKHVRDHNLMRVQILDALKLASDPAKLVLDALSSFYRSKSREGFKGAALCNARKSCILLLEQLMTFSVQINHHVNEEALKLAAEWKERMEDKYPQGVMAYGFLLFIITYNLKSNHDADQLFCLLVTASKYRQSPELCLALGLEEKISILTETLIKENLRLEAIAYICAFDLADKFPPSRLLNDHLKYSKRRIYQNSKRSNEKQNLTIEREIAIVRRVIGCITDHKLESLYPPENLEKHILHLESQKDSEDNTARKEKQKADRKGTLSVSSNSDKPLQECGLKWPNMSAEAIASTFDFDSAGFTPQPPPLEQPVGLIADQAAPWSLWDCSTFPADSISFNWQRGCAVADKRSLEQFIATGAYGKAASESSIHHVQQIDQSQFESFQPDGFVHSEATSEQSKTFSSSFGIDLQSYITRMDARGLISFLCEHVEHHNLMRREISDALQLAPDPAKLVLDVLSTFHGPHPWNIPQRKKKSGCVFNSEGLCKVRKSCILLLEQLRTFPLQIEPHVNEEVLKLAAIWKERMQKHQKGVMAYGFLQLIVTYSLMSAYDANELLSHLILATEYRQSPDLCLALGLADKIRVLIETLIKNNQRLEAIAYICAFDLIDKFPPAHVLKVHLEYSKESLYQKAKSSNWKWHQIIDHEIGIVRKVIECIADNKLESLYPPEDLKYHIIKLERQKAEQVDAARKEKQKTGWRKPSLVPPANSKPQQESENAPAEASPSTSTNAGSTSKLSAFQVLESFFADQAVPRGLWDNTSSSANMNILSGKRHADMTIIADNGSSESDCNEP